MCDLNYSDPGERVEHPSSDQQNPFVSHHSPVLPQASRSSTTRQHPPHTNGTRDNPVATRSTQSHTTAGQTLDDVTSVAIDTSDCSLSPETVNLIVQKVFQYLRAYTDDPPAMGLATELSRLTSGHQLDATTEQDSNSIDPPVVCTSPPPYQFEEESVGSQPLSTMSANDATKPCCSETVGQVREPHRSTVKDVDMSPEVTVLERCWGKLFDGYGQSTMNLQWFLRGIAIHLLEVVEPKNTLVITPDKMQKFYALTELDGRAEVYQWCRVFDDKTSSLSRLFRAPGVQVEHHLVQIAPHARPDIPGLTQQGFAAWITLLIRAHPDHEHERLSKALRVMAINHPEDGIRFPAAIPRRLFPSTADGSISVRLSELMRQYCNINSQPEGNAVTLPNHTETPLETSSSLVNSTNPPDSDVKSAQVQRESPTQSRSFASVSDVSGSGIIKEQHPPTLLRCRSFERRRKSYIPTPRTGKAYDLSTRQETKSGRDRSDLPLSTHADHFPVRDRVWPPDPLSYLLPKGNKLSISRDPREPHKPRGHDTREMAGRRNSDARVWQRDYNELSETPGIPSDGYRSKHSFSDNNDTNPPLRGSRDGYPPSAYLSRRRPKGPEVMGARYSSQRLPSR